MCHKVEIAKAKAFIDWYYCPVCVCAYNSSTHFHAFPLPNVNENGHKNGHSSNIKQQNNNIANNNNNNSLS